jgi:hypothetical protein
VAIIRNIYYKEIPRIDTIVMTILYHVYTHYDPNTAPFLNHTGQIAHHD